MRQEMLTPMYDWARGVFAGALPLVVFQLSAVFGAPGKAGVDSYHDGMIGHLLIMAMVTSAVGVATCSAQAFSGNIPGFLRDGRGPLILTLLLIGTMTIATALYALHETGMAHGPMRTGATWVLIAALLISFYTEVALSRLHTLEGIRAQTAAKEAAEVAKQRSIPVDPPKRWRLRLPFGRR